MKLNKKNSEEEFWPRLLIDKALEKTNVSIDWNKYVDEDEADGNDFNVDDLNGGMDFSNLGKAGFGSNTSVFLINIILMSFNIFIIGLMILGRTVTMTWRSLI